MAIPKEAKCVFKGKIFDVYQWEQKMYDGSYVTFEKLDRPNTIRVLAVKGDKILIAKESQPHKFHEEHYNLFGGRQDKGESSLECAKRELLEESGLVSLDLEEFGRYAPQPKLNWELIVYIAKDCKKIKEPETEAGEKIEIIELEFDEFIEVVKSKDFVLDNFALDILRMKNLDEFKKRIFT